METDSVDVRRLCAAHKGPQTAAAVEPGYLCAGCEKNALEALRTIARLWDSLDDIGNGGRNGGGGAGANSQAPTRLDILAVQDPRSGFDGELPPVARIVFDWADLVASERRFARPRDTYSQVRFLMTNFRWIVEDRDAGRFAREVRQCAAVLERLCGENRRVIARCQAPIIVTVEDDEGDLVDRTKDCGGPLFQDADGAAAVTCAKCGDRFSDGAVFQSFGELRRLGLILEAGGRP